MKLKQPKTYNVDRSNTLTLTNISDMKYVTEDKSVVDCVVVFKEFPLEPMPFTADKFDNMAHGREIYNDIISGEFGGVADYEPPKDEEGEV